jgi:four helix bundle protein
MCICLEEADESLFWLELLRETQILPASRLTDLEREFTEIVAMLSKARKNLQSAR